MHHFRYRTVVALFAAAAVVFLPFTPSAVADDPCEAPNTTCIYTIDRSSPCGLNMTTDGETCVDRSSITLRYATEGSGVHVVAYHEEANGDVRAFNTDNAWSTQDTGVTFAVFGQDGAVTTRGFLSGMEPASSSAGQLERSVTVTTEFTSAWTFGARVLMRNSEPVHCGVFTPLGGYWADCRLTPVFELLP